MGSVELAVNRIARISMQQAVPSARSFIFRDKLGRLQSHTSLGLAIERII